MAQRPSANCRSGQILSPVSTVSKIYPELTPDVTGPLLQPPHSRWSGQEIFSKYKSDLHCLVQCPSCHDSLLRLVWNAPPASAWGALVTCSRPPLRPGPTAPPSSGSHFAGHLSSNTCHSLLRRGLCPQICTGQTQHVGLG